MSRIIKCKGCGKELEVKTAKTKWCKQCKRLNKAEYARQFRIAHAEEEKRKREERKKSIRNVDIKCTLIRYAGDFDRYKKEIWGE